MATDPEIPAAEGAADDEVEDLEPTDPEADVTGGGSAGKGGSIVVMDPTNVTRP